MRISLSTSKTSASAYYFRSKAKLKLHKYSDANEDMKKAIELDSTYADVSDLCPFGYYS